METLAERFQLAPELSEVIDLPIEGDRTSGGGINHRLSPGLAEVDDREPAVPKDYFARVRDPLASAVGSPVSLGGIYTCNAGRH
jgi:hypothetical protein